MNTGIRPFLSGTLPSKGGAEHCIYHCILWTEETAHLDRMIEVMVRVLVCQLEHRPTGQLPAASFPHPYLLLLSRYFGVWSSGTHSDHKYDFGSHTFLTPMPSRQHILPKSSFFFPQRNTQKKLWTSTVPKHTANHQTAHQRKRYKEESLSATVVLTNRKEMFTHSFTWDGLCRTGWPGTLNKNHHTRFANFTDT